MGKLKSIVLGIGLALALPTAAQAATLVVNLRDIFTNAPFRDPGNIVSFYDIGSSSEIVGLAFDLNIFAADPSWLSEPTIHITDSTTLAGLAVNPGVNEDFPGTGHYADSADLTDLGYNFSVGTDGLLRLEYADSFDDFLNAPDGILNGTVTFTYNLASAAPEPASWAMMLLGFGVAGAALRRRRSSGIPALG